MLGPTELTVTTFKKLRTNQTDWLMFCSLPDVGPSVFVTHHLAEVVVSGEAETDRLVVLTDGVLVRQLHLHPGTVPLGGVLPPQSPLHHQQGDVGQLDLLTAVQLCSFVMFRLI